MNALQMGYYLGTFFFGASVGFWGIIFSNISYKLTKTPLGFAPISLKKLIKTSMLTGSIVLVWTLITALLGISRTVKIPKE